MIKNIIILVLLLMVLSECGGNGTQAKPTLGGIGKVLNCMFEPYDELCIAERARQKEHLQWKLIDHTA